MASVRLLCAAGQWLDRPLATIRHFRMGWLERTLWRFRPYQTGDETYKGETVTWLGKPCDTHIQAENGRIQRVAVSFMLPTLDLHPFQLNADQQIADVLGIPGEMIDASKTLWKAPDATVLLVRYTAGVNTHQILGLYSKDDPRPGFIVRQGDSRRRR